MLQDPIEIAANVLVRITHGCETPMLVPPVASGVTAWLMSVTVHLDDKGLLRTKEIDDAVADDVLTSELITAELRTAQMPPKARFEWRHVASKLMRSFDQMR